MLPYWYHELLRIVWLFYMQHSIQPPKTFDQAFREKKERVNVILADNGHFPNDGPLDKGIAPLVYKINKLEEVLTFSSCSGHLRTKEYFVADAIKKYGSWEEGKKFYVHHLGDGDCLFFPGNLSLIFRGAEAAESIMKEISTIPEKVDGAVLNPWHSFPFYPKIDSHGLILTINFQPTFACDDNGHIPAGPLAIGMERDARQKEVIKHLSKIFS